MLHPKQSGDNFYDWAIAIVCGSGMAWVIYTWWFL